MEFEYEASMITLLAVLMILISFGNILVIAAYCRNKKLQTSTNWFVVQLAWADMMVALLMPLQILMFIRDDLVQDLHVCIFRYSLLMSSMTSSVLCLLAISVDRFVSVAKPYLYKSSPGNKLKILGAAFVWLPSALVIVWVHTIGYHDRRPGVEGKKVCDFLYVMRPSFIKYVLLPIFMVLSIAITVLYSKVFCIARKHVAAIDALLGHLACPGADLQQTHIKRQMHKKNMKITKTAAFILGMFLLCMLPFFTITGIQVYAHQIFSSTWMAVRMYASLLSILNSALNPLIYAGRLEDFRNEFKKILSLRRNTIAASPGIAVGSCNNNGQGVAPKTVLQRCRL